MFRTTIFIPILISLILQSCLILPANIGSTMPKDKLASLPLYITHKEDIDELLGNNAIKRDNGSIVIHSKGEDAAYIFVPDKHTLIGRIEIKDYEWLFLRFDRDGYLIEKELVEAKNGCTTSGYCIEKGWVKIGKNRELGKNKTILVKKSPSDEDAAPATACQVHLFLSKDNDFTPVYFPLSLNINGQGPYVSDENTYTLIHTDKHSIQFTLTDLKLYKNTRLAGDGLFTCSKKKLYLKFWFTNNKGMKQFFGKPEDPMWFARKLHVIRLDEIQALSILQTRNPSIGP